MKLFKFFTLLVFLMIGCSRGPSPEEVVNDKLHRFYSSPSSDILNEALPKFSTKTNERIYPNGFLKFEKPTQNLPPLLATAQKKGTEWYQKNYCQNVLAKHFPDIDCSRADSYTWATIEPNDQPEDLLRTYSANPVRDLSALPAKGRTSIRLWSDDYWKIRWGITSYRYSTGKSFSSYREAVDSYAQPLEWTGLLSSPDPATIEETIVRWSPSEKYDLSVGDETFRLTKEQKQEGEGVLGDNGDVEGWMGICHGWAAAAIVVPSPEREVTFVGAKGKNVKWYPHDIRALASLAWANGRSRSGFVGGRCNTKNTETFPNGRLKDPTCFDNNPATFHIVLGNQIGIEKSSFIMDAAFDYEVWNQPIAGYEFTYFNPLDPDKKSSDWKEVVVPYNEAFKAKDRFQKPLTRGVRSEAGYDDSAVESIVGVIAKVSYLTEVRPLHGPAARESELADVYYHYDLELSRKDGQLVPTGGEWHTNFHPDFLWVPEKGQVALSYYDMTPIDFNGKAVPSSNVTTIAQRASAQGNPLCKVLSALVNESNVSGAKYVCR